VPPPAPPLHSTSPSPETKAFNVVGRELRRRGGSLYGPVIQKSNHFYWGEGTGTHIANAAGHGLALLRVLHEQSTFLHRRCNLLEKRAYGSNIPDITESLKRSNRSVLMKSPSTIEAEPDGLRQSYGATPVTWFAQHCHAAELKSTNTFTKGAMSLCPILDRSRRAERESQRQGRCRSTSAMRSCWTMIVIKRGKSIAMEHTDLSRVSPARQGKHIIEPLSP